MIAYEELDNALVILKKAKETAYEPKLAQGYAYEDIINWLLENAEDLIDSKMYFVDEKKWWGTVV